MKSRAKGTGTIFKPKGSRFWWIAYVSGGKRRFEGTKSERKQDAQALLTQRLGDSGKGMVVTPKMGKVTLLEGLKAFVDDLKINKKKSAHCNICKCVCNVEGHTNDTWRRVELHVLTYFDPARRMATITTADIEAYKVHRSVTQKAAAASVNRELAALRRAFRLALRGGTLASMPHISLLTENNARKGFFEQAELDAILAHLPADLQPVVKFLSITGWRKSEALSLTVSHVDLDAGTVKLDPGTTKSGRGRTFIFTEDLAELMTAQFASIDALKQAGTICPWIFHRADGSRIKSLRGAWEAATKTAGYPDKLLHDFRRTAVRNLDRAGVPRSTAMKMVGHETESIYNRYAIQDEAMLREGAEKLSAWTKAQSAATKQRGQLKKFASVK